MCQPHLCAENPIKEHGTACMQGSQAEQNTALQEVNCLQQQAALHLRGLRTLIEVSGAAAAAADSAEGGKTATHGSDAVHQFSGLDVREQISILEEHLLQSLLLPAAHAALRYASTLKLKAGRHLSSVTVTAHAS